MTWVPGHGQYLYGHLVNVEHFLFWYCSGRPVSSCPLGTPAQVVPTLGFLCGVPPR